MPDIYYGLLMSILSARCCLFVKSWKYDVLTYALLREQGESSVYHRPYWHCQLEY